MCSAMIVLLYFLVLGTSLDHGDRKVFTFDRRERFEIDVPDPQEHELIFVFTASNCTATVELVSNLPGVTKRSKLFNHVNTM